MIQAPRQCNALAWNNQEPNIFAAGYEQYKNESTILIWDINRTVNPNYNKIRTAGTVEATFSLPGE